MTLVRFSLLGALWLILGAPFLLGQTARDRAVELNATAQASPPRITLQWNATTFTLTQQRVFRRLKGGGNWALLATTLTTATTHTDTTATVGVNYEYRVARTFSGAPETAVGYASSGIQVPLVTDRGRAILLVDDTMAAPLAAELARFESDLVGDGWTVVRQDVSRTATPTSIRALVQSIYSASPANTQAVILFGHIPVPYSGDEFMDGHPDHAGAWPTDLYYGEMDGVWTDNTVNNSSALDPRNRNVPGDGKFDQTVIPSDVELQVGRIDLANMPAFGVSETELLRRYLDRDHAYRHALGGFANVERRGLIDDHFGYFDGEAFAVSAWRSFAACVGLDNVFALDWFGTLQTQSYLWGYGCGGGDYQQAEGVGSVNDFAGKDSRAVFTLLFGSYFGDWDNPDAFLRAPLGGTVSSLGLVSCWAGRPQWFFHPMALGETVGYAARITQNNAGGQQNGYALSFGARHNHVALLGDPTLRLYPIPPPTNHLATVSPTAVTLTWNASPDAGIAGYWVGRARSAAGPFVPLQTELVSGTSFTDTTAAQGTSYRYLVRAVKLEVSPTGSYFNGSQGAFSVSGNTPIENWRLENFGTVSNAGDAADEANIDGDAGNNLLEYALGRDPRQPEMAPLFHTEVNAGGYLQIEFARLVTRTDLRYIVEASSDLLGTWTPIASSVHGAPVIASGAHSSVETGTGEVRTVTVEDSAPAATFAKRFLRLRVVRD